MNNNVIYFPGLNGLRAIAALAVVVSHITIGLNSFGLNPYIIGSLDGGRPRGISLAGYGVSIFFVLSGFLITYLLLAEKENSPIVVKKFYLRRILRIWPLYYVYLLVAIISSLAFGSIIDLKALIFYVFFAANVPFIMGSTLPLLSHYWSLGVEEQFYLIWPWLCKKVNSIIIPLVVITLTIITLKVGLHLFYPNSILELIISVTRFHCMMIGAIGAILFRERNSFFLNLLNNKLAQVLAWLTIVLLAVNKFHVASIIDNELVSVVALVLIIGQIEVDNRIVNLEVKIMDFLGKISYGIYVIHPLLIFFLSKILIGIKLSPFYKYPLVYLMVVGLTIFSSFLSYKYIERYFLSYKKKFEVVKSASTSQQRTN
jgi:peptidoglycan/LPS O-acetylase OafA/YrhL